MIAAVISIGLVVWLSLLPSAASGCSALSLALILSGALGNLWDRVTLGYVVDFISVHYQQRYFPAFNVADSAISVGAALMILDSFLHKEDASNSKEESAP